MQKPCAQMTDFITENDTHIIIRKDAEMKNLLACLSEDTKGSSVIVNALLLYFRITRSALSSGIKQAA